MTGAYSKKGDVWKLISVLVLGLYAVILIYPLCRLFKEAVISSDGKFTLDGFKAFFSKSYYVGSIGNSLKVSHRGSPRILLPDV